ncbi:hypothetical protein RJ639_046980 [Escallonia herrerae]|uniref:Integrase catalytic domain-containing protein n=1 Tax=Escallonia herrerae TaxID=1293975 RepID=A0AA88W3I6_9ASTE|nr:hypothetical protein RJ639_046980 [Escallonia herrerae]
MTNPDFETSGTKSSPIVIQSKGSSFKAGIILNDTNYDLWSQIMEMHIAEKEKLSFIRDHRDKVIMESENDVESYRKSVQRQRVHIFLAGLDGEFEQVRAEILRKDPIPELEACHALIRRESIRRTKMFEESERTELQPWTSSTAVVETKTEDDVTGQHSALAAAAGNGGKALNMSTLVTNSAWIIDSGATDHMTFDSRHVSTLKQSSQKFVTTANGTLAPIIGEGHLPVTDNMNLDSVLVVPSLDYNLFEVNVLFQQFCKMIHTQYNARIQVLRSDNGGEYLSAELQQYLKAHGIIHQTTCSNTPQQNGVAERKNRHLLDVVRASLIEAHLPLSYWGEALISAAYLINRGEHQKEIQTLDYDDELAENVDVHISEDELSEPVNQVGKFVEESSQEHAETEVVTPSQSEFDTPHATDTPHQSLTEDAPEPHRKQLPQRLTRETFAPVAKINTVRVLLSLAVNLNWPLQQFDVKNAFLHGDLSEEVYMELPPGCMMPKTDSQKVCKLHKALYGLKKSPRAWFGRFTKSMRAFGYHQSNSDHTLFLKKKQGKITALIVYVDDMVVTGNDPEEREALQGHLSREFKMKDLGPLKYFLGIEVSRSKKWIFLSQRKYALDLLRETGMLACQPVDTPVEEGLKLRIESNQVPVDKGRYQRLVGRMMYLAHTRPDLAYALSISVDVYTDADWAGAVDDRRSTSGYFTFVGDLGCVSKQPIKLYCDNKAACDIAHNPVQHDRTKHVEIDRFFIKEKLDEKIVELPHIRSEDQLADILTKAVSSRVFSKFLSKLGMGISMHQLEGECCDLNDFCMILSYFVKKTSCIVDNDCLIIGVVICLIIGFGVIVGSRLVAPLVYIHVHTM